MSDNFIDYSKEKTKIEAFYYHEKGRFTAAVLENGTLHMNIVRNAVISFDSTGDLWYECDYIVDTWNGSGTRGACYVHLKTIDDINNSGWNHGKFGSGTTVRLN